MVRENVTSSKESARTLWLHAVALLAQLLPSAAAIQPVSATEHEVAKHGKTCVEVCNPDGSSAQPGNVCWIPGPGGGEVHFSPDVVKKMPAIREGKEFPPMALPELKNFPWCKIELTKDEIEKIRKAYGFRETQPAGEEAKDLDLPTLPTEEQIQEILKQQKQRNQRNQEK